MIELPVKYPNDKERLYPAHHRKSENAAIRLLGQQIDAIDANIEEANKAIAAHEEAAWQLKINVKRWEDARRDIEDVFTTLVAAQPPQPPRKVVLPTAEHVEGPEDPEESFDVMIEPVQTEPPASLVAETLAALGYAPVRS